jgi:predicted porin
MKAIFQYETTYSGTDSSTAFGSARNSYIGLAGNWGQVRVGRHDTPMKVAFYAAGNEHIADSIVDINRIGFTERRVNNAIAYISPSFSGFTLAAAIVPGEQSGESAPNFITTTDDYISCTPYLGEDAEVSESASCSVYAYTNTDTHRHSFYDNDSNPTGEDYSGTDYTSYDSHSHSAYVGSVTSKLNAGQDNDENGLMDSYSIGLMYGGNGLKASVGYERLADFSNTTVQSNDDIKTWQAGASYTFGNFTLGGQYEDTDMGYGDYDVWALMGKAKFGNNAIVANYGQAEMEYDGCSKCDEEMDTIQLALQHTFSKRTSVYVAYRNQDFDDNIDDDDIDTFSLGMIHTF